MRRFGALFICLIIVLAGFFYSNTLVYQSNLEQEVLTKGLVLDVEEMEPTGQGIPGTFVEKQWQVAVRITEGPYAGRVVETIHYQADNPAYDFSVLKGDKVILSLDVDNHVLKEAYISGLDRERYLYYLLVGFMLSIMLIGAKNGVKTILSLGITCWAVLKILLPAILVGKDPIFVSILICTGITIITHMLITGFTRKSLAAIAGTVMGLVLGGIIAKYTLELTRINGLNTEESQLLYFTLNQGQLDVTGLFFAGILIGSLGAVMDVAMSIASSVKEIYQVNPRLSFGQLVKSGLNVGRDIIGTMANTLILAYTGSSLPLMLLIMANDIPYIKYINLDIIAAEIIRALAGSIGLILAVPFTALLSALLYKKFSPKVDVTRLET